MKRARRPSETGARPSGVGRLLQERLDLDEQLDGVLDHHAAAVHGDVEGDAKVGPVDLAGAENPARVFP